MSLGGSRLDRGVADPSALAIGWQRRAASFHDPQTVARLQPFDGIRQTRLAEDARQTVNSGMRVTRTGRYIAGKDAAGILYRLDQHLLVGHHKYSSRTPYHTRLRNS